MSDPYAAIASPAKADPYAHIASPAPKAKPAPKPPVAQWVDEHLMNDKGPVGQAFRGMRQSVDQQAAQHQQRANTPTPSAKGPLDYLGQEVSGAVGGAWNKLKADVANDYQHTKAQAGMSYGQAAADQVRGYGRGAKIVGDVAGLALSPIGAAAHAVIVRPAASGAAMLPGVNYGDAEQVIGNALQGMGPKGRMAGGGAGYAARTAAQARVAGSKAAAVARPNALQETLGRFDQSNVRMPLAAAKPGLAPIAKVTASNAFAGARPRAFIRGAIGDVQAEGGRIAGEYGNGGTRQAAGQTIQKGVENFANGKDGVTFKTRSGDLYDNVFGGLDKAMAGKQSPRTVTPVQQPIGPGAFSVGADGAVSPATIRAGSTVTGGSKISTTNAQTALHDMTEGSAQAKPIADLISSPTLVKVAKAVKDGTGDMSFNDLRRLRTWVREAKQDSDLRSNIGAGNLDRLEGALTQDIYANAKGLGSPKLLHQLQRADDYYAAGMERLNGKLNGVFKAKSDESAFDMIQKAAMDGGGADLARLTAAKRSLGADWGDVAATMAKRLGKPAPGAVRGGAEGGEPFSLSSFMTNYAKLSDAGKETVFGARAGGGAKATQLKAALDNLVSVAGDLKAVESAGNHSNTATHLQTLGTVAGVAHPATTVPTLMGLAGEALTGEVVTNPAVARWIVRRMQAKTPAQTAATGAQLQQLIKANPKLAGQLKTLGTTLNVAAPATGYTSPASSKATEQSGSR